MGLGEKSIYVEFTNPIQGLAGTSGTSGISGSAGTHGTSGTSGTSGSSGTSAVNDKIIFTAEGGLAIKLTNKTGSDSVKGYCVTNDGSTNNAVVLVPVGEPDCIGVFYEDGVADGSEAWVVVSGIADVYFWGSTTRGHLARTGLAVDTGEVSGQALSEAIPTSPFSTDKHFCEIGHVLETRTGAGLAKCILHFN